ncbi:MAG: mycothione reductase [Nocardioidaceae bacterium]
MRHHDLIIVGSGSGNRIADKTLRHLDIAIVEESTFGGTCSNVGCIPTKMLVHTADVAAAARDSSRFGIDVRVDKVRWADIRERIFGRRIDPISVSGRRYRQEGPNTTLYEQHVEFTGPRRLRLASGEQISADRIVLAAGSRAVIPDLVGLDGVDPDRVHTSDTVMRIDDLPASMVIVGGGVIAAEMAHVFSALGTAVTVVARSELLLRDEDDDVRERFTAVAARQWDLRGSRLTSRVEPTSHGVRLHLEDPNGRADPRTASGEILLIATGRTPNSDRLNLAAGGIDVHEDGRVVVDDYQQTTADGVFALGDLSSPWELKHVANHEARVVQHNLLHPDAMTRSDHRFVPRAVFSHPQIASVGAKERDLVEAGVRYVSGARDYGSVAYGWAMEDTTGFAKVLADPDTGLFLGAHLVGPQASSLIQPLIQAMSFGLSAKEMARGQYWIHPALAEVVENAVLALPLTP